MKITIVKRISLLVAIVLYYTNVNYNTPSVVFYSIIMTTMKNQ